MGLSPPPQKNYMDEMVNRSMLLKKKNCDFDICISPSQHNILVYQLLAIFLDDHPPTSWANFFVYPWSIDIFGYHPNIAFFNLPPSHLKWRAGFALWRPVRVPHSVCRPPRDSRVSFTTRRKMNSPPAGTGVGEKYCEGAIMKKEFENKLFFRSDSWRRGRTTELVADEINK